MRLKVIEKEDGRVVTEVVRGKKLSDRKGVSLPDTILRSGALTEKDRKDLDVALGAGVDWIALSFVQRPEDIAEARKIVRGRAGIMAKIEKPQAFQRLDEIMELSDAIMVARGDLGVEMPLESVPGVQKQMTRAARRVGKPVVVATQMLESMISAAVPTRAEVSDVAIAVFEGADAVMLSAESAAGEYPVEAVETMNRIAEAVEQDPLFATIIHAQRTEPESTGADTITSAARQIAETLGIAAIVCYTSSGSTGVRASRERPGSTHHRAFAGREHGTPAFHRLGAALRSHRGRAQHRRDGGPGLRHRLRRRLCVAGSAYHHHRGRSVRHAERHQPPAHRLHCARRSVWHLSAARSSFPRSPLRASPAFPAPRPSAD